MSSILSIDTLARASREGTRLTRTDGLFLLQQAPLSELGVLAGSVRDRHNPPREVTFVVDTNPNYTNICTTSCAFCAFYRKPGDAQGYTLTLEEVMQKIAAARDQGATTVLLQGGHNPELPLDYYLTLVRETRRRFPESPPISSPRPRSCRWRRSRASAPGRCVRSWWKPAKSRCPEAGPRFCRTASASAWLPRRAGRPPGLR